MKKINSLCLALLFFQITHGQSKPTFKNDYKVNFIKARFNKGLTYFGSDKEKFGISLRKSETLFNLVVIIEIENLNNQTIVDFNCFSLLDNSSKLRYRPRRADLKNYYIKTVKLTDYEFEDTFTKYSQDGYKNYPLYIFELNSFSFKIDESNEYRIQPTSFKNKNKKTIKFGLTFPTHIKKNGNFSLLYKNKFLSNFSLK